MLFSSVTLDPLGHLVPPGNGLVFGSLYSSSDFSVDLLAVLPVVPASQNQETNNQQDANDDGNPSPNTEGSHPPPVNEIEPYHLLEDFEEACCVGHLGHVVEYDLAVAVLLNLGAHDETVFDTVFKLLVDRN